MASVNVDSDTIDRLAHLDSGGRPVLSMYVDLDPSRFPTRAEREGALAALLSRARREAGESEVERVRETIRSRPELIRRGRGLAIFCSLGGDALEVLPLPESVEPRIVVDRVPWLEPLTATVAPDNWGVAVISRRGARLFRGGPHGLREFASIDDSVHGRHAQGGWSQARYQRGIEEQVAAHVRNVCERLRRFHLRRPFAQIVIVAARDLHPVVEAGLHSDLRKVLAGVVAGDLEQARPDELVEAVGPVFEHARSKREQRLLERLEEALATGGAAAAGWEEVASMLEEGRVGVLLVPEGTSGSSLERTLTSAREQAAEVVLVRDEERGAELERRGGIAALLRW